MFPYSTVPQPRRIIVSPSPYAPTPMGLAGTATPCFISRSWAGASNRPDSSARENRLRSSVVATIPPEDDPQLALNALTSAGG